MNEPQQLLNVSQMAKILNVPVSWLYRYTSQTGPGSIPRMKLGKYLRFEAEKVMEWIRNRNAV